MTKKVVAYFDNTIMPLVQNQHANIMSEMNIMILGSVGLGIDDELSDMEAVIYLPELIWKQHGAQLQLTLNKCLAETNPWKHEGTIISVHPLTWMLDGQGEGVLANEGNFNWEDISFESFFNIQENLIYYDSQERLNKVRKATSACKMPDKLWKKALLMELKDFVENSFHDLKQSIKRKKFSEAQIHLGHAVESLFRIGFLTSHQYYPWRTHLRWAFNKLQPPISDLGSEFDVLAISPDWDKKLNIVETIFDVYKKYITKSSVFPELDMQKSDLELELIWAERLSAWDNPNWRDFITERAEKAIRSGYSSDQFWVWSLWGLD